MSWGRPREERTTDIPGAPGRSPQRRTDADDWGRDAFEGIGFREPPRTRRLGRPRATTDRDLAVLAKFYVEALDRGITNPTRDAAREGRCSQSRARPACRGSQARHPHSHRSRDGRAAI